MTQLSAKTTENNGSKALKIWGAVALFGLFGCGLIVGLTLRGGHEKTQLTQGQCETLKDKIGIAIRNSDIEKVKELQAIYEKSCVEPVADAKKVEKVHKEEKKELTTCERIESLLLGEVSIVDSTDPTDHERNARIYEKLSDEGCPKNHIKFIELSANEKRIARTLREFYETSDGVIDEEQARPCEVIEYTLKERLSINCSHCYYDTYLDNAKIYSNLSENGCPENSEKFKQLAAAQLEIASALMSKEQMTDKDNATAVVDTYKKLQMEQKANEYLDKARKLVGPASDFILTIGKVINE